jgi:hypothetical protein
MERKRAWDGITGKRVYGKRSATGEPHVEARAY